jgi:hypothetical protein
MGGLPMASLPSSATAAEAARADAATARSAGLTKQTPTVVPTRSESVVPTPVMRRRIAAGTAAANMMSAKDGSRGRNALSAGAAMRRSAFASTPNANIVARKDDPAGTPVMRRSISFSRRYTMYTSPNRLATSGLLSRFSPRAAAGAGDVRARCMGIPSREFVKSVEATTGQMGGHHAIWVPLPCGQLAISPHPADAGLTAPC